MSAVQGPGVRLANRNGVAIGVGIYASNFNRFKK